MRRLPGLSPLRQVIHLTIPQQGLSSKCEPYCDAWLEAVHLYSLSHSPSDIAGSDVILTPVHSCDVVLVSCRHAECCFGLCIGTEALFRRHGMCASSSQCCLYGSRGLRPGGFLEKSTSNRLMIATSLALSLGSSCHSIPCGTHN